MFVFCKQSEVCSYCDSVILRYLLFCGIAKSSWKIKNILTLYIFTAECSVLTPIEELQDCCDKFDYRCDHNQGNCKSDEDCLGDLTCKDTCPDGFPDGIKCCFNSGKCIFYP